MYLKNKKEIDRKFSLSAFLFWILLKLTLRHTMNNGKFPLYLSVHTYARRSNPVVLGSSSLANDQNDTNQSTRSQRRTSAQGHPLGQLAQLLHVQKIDSVWWCLWSNHLIISFRCQHSCHKHPWFFVKIAHGWYSLHAKFWQSHQKEDPNHTLLMQYVIARILVHSSWSYWSIRLRGSYW